MAYRVPSKTSFCAQAQWCIWLSAETIVRAAAAVQLAVVQKSSGIFALRLNVNQGIG
jgi:hypothetical protein